MIVKCKYNIRSKLPPKYRQYAFGGDDSILPVTLEKRYVVVGIETIDNDEFVLIIDDDNEITGTPWWHYKGLFQVIDESRPDDWKLIKSDSHSIETFPDLADNKNNFYSNLQDGEQYELKIFLKHYEKYARHHGLWYVDGKPAT